MRIGGISSGIDTESIVRNLMQAERLKVNKFLRDEQTLKWRQESYNSINSSMANFILNTRKDFGLTQISYNGTIRNSSVNSLDWVKKATSSNEGLVTAKARADAINGTHKIEVTSLASVANTTSNLLKGNDDPLNDVLDENNKFIAGGKFTITTDIGSKEITVTAGETINTFINKLNSAVAEGGDNDGKSLGIRAAYDKDLGKFMISTRETGLHKTIKITPDTEETPPSLAEKIFSNKVINDGEVGKDAAILFNGSELTKSTNVFSVFGIELQLKGLTEGSEINISVETNVDGVYDKIKSFVDSYNQMIDEINGLTGQKQNRNFHPLTQDEKDSMSEKEIELWEEKAKSGILRNDEVLTRILQNTRINLYQKVENASGSYNHITDIGIATGDYRQGGKLVIDEDRLRNAIINDPDGVLDLFFKEPPSNLTGSDRTKESGLVQRIYDEMVTGMKDVIRRSGTGGESDLYRSVQNNMLLDFVTDHSSISVIEKNLMDINSRIANEERLLIRKEDHYWKRFTAMEKAIGQMNQQSMWLMSQLGLG